MLSHSKKCSEDANDHRIKVAFVLPTMNPGGAERVLVTLLNNIDREQFDVYFISLADKGHIWDWITSGVTTSTLNKGSVRSALPSLYRKLKNIRPDVVVTTMTHSNAGILLLKPFFSKARFIIRESSLPSALMGQYGRRGKVFRYIYQYLYPYADALISPARAIQDEFTLQGFSEKINHVLLRNPIDEQKIISTLKPPSKCNTHGVRFVSVGRLEREKGYDRLLNAIGQNKVAMPRDWRLDIVGEGQQRAELERIIKEFHFEGHVNLIGYSDQPWPYVYRADFFVLPSRWEGMPNAALEALACGTPVIAHKEAGGIHEVATLSGIGDVRIADDMDRFLEFMKDSDVRHDKAYPPLSLLPQEFSLDQVICNFEGLLKNTRK